MGTGTGAATAAPPAAAPPPGPTDKQLEDAKDDLWGEFQSGLGNWFTRPNVRNPDGSDRKYNHGEVLRGNWAQYPARKAETERCMRLAGKISRALMEFRRESRPNTAENATRHVIEKDISLAEECVKQANAQLLANAGGIFHGVVC